MRKRTIAAALLTAAPLLALLSPEAAACWGTGYGYTATTAAAPVAPRRYGYMGYGYSSPAYYGGYGGYYGGYGGYGITRGIARRNIRRAAYGGIGYRGGVGVRRGLGVGVGRVGRFR
jgi:hypothetical protein